MHVPAATAATETLLNEFRRVRGDTERLAEPLSPEDQILQSMPDASPVKWHRAHTTWFFEAFVLKQYDPDYRPFDERFNFLYNSYYEAMGARHPRPQRGLLSRPSVEEVGRYRAHVDEAMARLIERSHGNKQSELASLIVLGCHHEQQHQELLLTDVLHHLSCNSIKPAYREREADAPGVAAPTKFVSFAGGLVDTGYDGDGFFYDNEGPRHKTYLRPFAIADRAVTNGEWLEFMRDGGYENVTLWFSDGWYKCGEEGWRAPLYWEERDGEWLSMTLGGLQPVNPAAPVTHVSYYEAYAFARWAGKRLPLEAEWELASAGLPVKGNTVGSGALRPLPAKLNGVALHQMFGDVWEWTASPYQPYPGFRAVPGAVGEYNGKFMVNQFVLRGGSCATPEGHIRPTYRNFFYPHQRWQFSGLRLAQDMEG
ncbi:MAG TPA: ergothioneine biosynthesis protein EgtB [Xanthobacteraceae bacterium]|nr:ergothioneine biosynthesis protein EgtB [Xanthobacteraceae bacterium]